MSISEQFVKNLDLKLYDDVVQLSLCLGLDFLETESFCAVGSPLRSLLDLMNEIDREGVRVECTIYQPTALLAFAQRMSFDKANAIAVRTKDAVSSVVAKTCPSDLFKSIDIITGKACSLLPASLLRDSRKLISQNSDMKPDFMKAGKLILSRGLVDNYPLRNYTSREVTKFVPVCGKQDVPIMKLAGKLSRRDGAYYEIVPFVLDREMGCQKLPQRPFLGRTNTNQGELRMLAS